MTKENKITNQNLVKYSLKFFTIEDIVKICGEQIESYEGGDFVLSMTELAYYMFKNNIGDTDQLEKLLES